MGLWDVAGYNGVVVGCGWMYCWGSGMWLDVMVGLWDLVRCNGGVVGCGWM